MCQVSCVTCHVSCVTCHVSHVTCHMSIFFIFLFFFGQSGQAYRWRVCYQRGLPRLVIYILGSSWNNAFYHLYLSRIVLAPFSFLYLCGRDYSDQNDNSQQFDPRSLCQWIDKAEWCNIHIQIKYEVMGFQGQHKITCLFSLWLCKTLNTTYCKNVLRLSTIVYRSSRNHKHSHLWRGGVSHRIWSGQTVISFQTQPPPWKPWTSGWPLC